jgi:hypothetical protein
MYRAKARRGWTVLSSNELQDLGLQADFISLAKSGLSLNNVSYRKPTVIYRSDACEFGLGGYNLVSGQAWRWELPMDLRKRTSINSLEFLACLITIWVDASRSKIQAEDCILSQSDSTSAAGWLRKSNFADDTDEFVQLSIARKLASLMIDTRSCLYSQWFSGDENNISDSLSRDFHLNSSNLSVLLSSNFPIQAPFGLEILPLPSDIVSWATSLLQSQPQAGQWSGEPTRSKFALGLVSRTTFGPSASATMTTWIPSIADNVTRSSALLLKPSERVDFLLSHPSLSRLNQSEPPWISWHRPSSWLTDQIHDWIPTENLRSFYNANFEDISQPIPEKFPRWQ